MFSSFLFFYFDLNLQVWAQRDHQKPMAFVLYRFDSDNDQVLDSWPFCRSFGQSVDRCSVDVFFFFFFVAFIFSFLLFAKIFKSSNLNKINPVSNQERRFNQTQTSPQHSIVTHSLTRSLCTSSHAHKTTVMFFSLLSFFQFFQCVNLKQFKLSSLKVEVGWLPWQLAMSIHIKLTSRMIQDPSLVPFPCLPRPLESVQQVDSAQLEINDDLLMDAWSPRN